MYVLLIILLELFVFYYIVHLYALVFIAFLYGWWYWDGKEYTGERRWDALRSLRIWRWLSPIQSIFPNKADMSQTRGKRLFVLPTTVTPSPLIWTFGLHGGALSSFQQQPIHYIVPPIYMWVPFLRDVLMWTGAVTYSLHKQEYSRLAVIQLLLESGRVVAYSPSNFFNPHAHALDLEAHIEHRYPDDETLRFCMNESVCLVPVVVNGERDRYRIVHHPFLHIIQTWFYQRMDYAFPFCYWFRLFNRQRPPEVTVKIGPSMTCNLYQTQADGVEKLRKALKDTVTQLSEPTKTMDSNKGDKDI